MKLIRQYTVTGNESLQHLRELSRAINLALQDGLPVYVRPLGRTYAHLLGTVRATTVKRRASLLVCLSRSHLVEVAPADCEFCFYEKISFKPPESIDNV